MPRLQLHLIRRKASLDHVRPRSSGVAYLVDQPAQVVVGSLWRQLNAFDLAESERESHGRAFLRRGCEGIDEDVLKGDARKRGATAHPGEGSGFDPLVVAAELEKPRFAVCVRTRANQSLKQAGCGAVARTEDGVILYHLDAGNYNAA